MQLFSTTFLKNCNLFVFIGSKLTFTTSVDCYISYNILKIEWKETFWNFLTIFLSIQKIHPLWACGQVSVNTSWSTFCHKSLVGENTLLLLCKFCTLAPLKHYAEAIQLSEVLSKVLEQLSWTFSSRRIRLRLRRLRSKFKGALLTIMLLKDLVNRTWGPFIDVLMLHYACPCCE